MLPTMRKEEKPKIEKVEDKQPPKQVVKKEAPKYLTENAVKIYNLIDDTPVHVDDLSSECNFSIERKSHI